MSLTCITCTESIQTRELVYHPSQFYIGFSYNTTMIIGRLKTLLGQWLNSSRKAKSDTLAYLNAVANAPCLQSASDHCSSNGILALDTRCRTKWLAPSGSRTRSCHCLLVSGKILNSLSKILNVLIIILSCPLGRGFLTGAIKSFEDFDQGDLRRTLPRFSPENFHKNLELVEKIHQLANKKGVHSKSVCACLGASLSFLVPSA